MHKTLVVFEFLTDPTTDYGVSCPCASKGLMIPTQLGTIHFF